MGRRQHLGWVEKSRERIKGCIQRKICVRSVEVGMVEDVERVGLELQGVAFHKCEILQSREIEPSLEWGAEDITTVAPIAGFLRVANLHARCDGRTARRDAALAGLKERDGEVVRVNIRNSDSGKRPGGKGIVFAALDSLLWRNSRSQRKNRIGDEVIGAEEDAAGRSREIDDAEGLATLGDGDALNSPAVRHRVDESGCIGSSRKLINITDSQHVRAIEIGGGVCSSGHERIV